MNRLKTLSRFGILTIGSAMAMGAASLGAQAADPIKIGYVGGISGACGGLTHSAIKAMKIAQAEINAAGGAAGRKLEIIWRDSKTKPDEGAKQVRDLIASEKVLLIVQPESVKLPSASDPTILHTCRSPDATDGARRPGRVP